MEIIDEGVLMTVVFDRLRWGLYDATKYMKSKGLLTTCQVTIDQYIFKQRERWTFNSYRSKPADMEGVIFIYGLPSEGENGNF